jgi:UTP--glucose-1-phosphate uridylyltransferase
MKAVITCGGIGSRLYPFTKELPKEMAPIFSKSNNQTIVKPLIQDIFEKLYDSGIREFCFVTGKYKRTIENHFTVGSKNSKDTKSFNSKLENSVIFWITQNEPNGFGHAVLQSKSFVGNEKFILQAGDVSFINSSNNPIRKLILKNKKDIDSILCIREVKDPQRHGIVTLEKDSDFSRIKEAIEKPKKPKTNLGIMPIYLLSSKIFDSLETTKPGINNEIQLTDAIQHMVKKKNNIYAINSNNVKFLDVGIPDAYWNSLVDSHQNCEETN